jgi:hypothetical protein
MRWFQVPSATWLTEMFLKSKDSGMKISAGQFHIKLFRGRAFNVQVI